MSIWAPVFSQIPRMVSPPFPISAPILSAGILMTSMRGAYLLSSLRGAGITLSMKSMIFRRASCAALTAPSTRSHVRPRSFRSTWKPVMPLRVPPTLKSMSPQWSSAPRMSVTRTFWLWSAFVKRPIDMPATVRLSGTPASMRARQPLQMEAIDDEPLEPMISETTRIEYGNSSGSTSAIERSASAPWPISRRPVEPRRPTSPVQYGGKL